jgi:thiosulfate reductase/polysulfide reductase chain A
LAEKLGLSQYYPWNNVEEYLKFRIEQAGFDWNNFKKEGIIKGGKEPIYIEEGLPVEFYTDSGKVEFYSTKLESLGLDPMPKYTKHETAPAGYFRLLFGRAPVHTFGMTQTNRLLSDMMDENEIWINIDIAGKYGLKTGDYIKLKNQDGIVSNKVKVKATQRIRTDCVYMVHGFGHTAKGMKGAYMKGASDSSLITKYVIDPLMGGTGMNMNFVTFETEV